MTMAIFVWVAIALAFFGDIFFSIGICKSFDLHPLVGVGLGSMLWFPIACKIRNMFLD